jgi:hypothetical protein
MDDLDRRTAKLAAAHAAWLHLLAEVETAQAEHGASCFAELPRPVRRRFIRQFRSLTPMTVLAREAAGLEVLHSVWLAKELGKDVDLIDVDLIAGQSRAN